MYIIVGPSKRAAVSVLDEVGAPLGCTTFQTNTQEMILGRQEGILRYVYVYVDMYMLICICSCTLVHFFQFLYIHTVTQWKVVVVPSLLIS